MKTNYENKVSAVALAAFVVIILIISLCTGCRPVQYIQGETITREVRVVERDTDIVTVADSASVSALLYCDSAYNVVLNDLALSEGERIKLEWQLALIKQNGRNMAALSVAAKEEEQTNKVTIKETYTTEEKERNIVEHKNSDFARFCIGWFWGCVAVVVIGVIVWAVKKFVL